MLTELPSGPRKAEGPHRGGGLLKKNPAALKHEIVDGDLVLTASTKQLQSFVLRHVNDKSAFTDPTDYARKK